MSLFNTIRAMPLSVAVTGFLLYLLTRSPPQYRNPIVQRLRQNLSPSAFSRLLTTLKWLLGLGVARNINAFLNRFAYNNFRLRSEAANYHWDREVAVVTGAAGGFGSRIAKDLTRHGLTVIAVDVAPELPADMQTYPRIHYYRCNLQSRPEVMALGERVRAEHGAPSVLVNNAGVMFEHSLLDASPRTINIMYGVNVIAHYWTLQAFLPAMIEAKKGHVVTISSLACFLAAPGMVPYSNSKAAVMSLHEGLMQELRVNYSAPQIKCTVVLPTYADTALTAPFADSLRATHQTVIKPQTVADAVVQQILACESRQILVAPGAGWLPSLRAWPLWLGMGVLRILDVVLPKVVAAGEERGIGLGGEQGKEKSG